MATAIATIVAALLAALGTVVVALINRKQSKAIAAVQHQVQNSHGTNLRDDLDLVLKGMEGIREDLRIHRLEHLKESV